jgi:hypothetical protein
MFMSESADLQPKCPDCEASGYKFGGDKATFRCVLEELKHCLEEEERDSLAYTVGTDGPLGEYNRSKRFELYCTCAKLFPIPVGKKRVQLSECLIQSIRTIWPDPTPTYVGFKSK